MRFTAAARGPGGASTSKKSWPFWSTIAPLAAGMQRPEAIAVRRRLAGLRHRDDCPDAVPRSRAAFGRAIEVQSRNDRDRVIFEQSVVTVRRSN